MRAVTAGVLACSLLWSLGGAAQGYYQNPATGRNVVWPPPGGVDRSAPPLWAPPAESVPRRHGASRRYLPSYRYRGWVPPPGADWPDAAPPPPPQGPPPLLEPGRPVEVVPPPGIPVESVDQQLSRQPQRGWRPVPADARLPAVPGKAEKGAAAPPAEKKGRPNRSAPLEPDGTTASEP